MTGDLSHTQEVIKLEMQWEDISSDEKQESLFEKWLSPEGIEASSLRQPTSSQCFKPAGAPLYPVANILFSLTNIAPTCRRRHVDLLATNRVMAAKYSDQDGLDNYDSLSRCS